MQAQWRVVPLEKLLMPIDGKCQRCAFKAPLISFVSAAEDGQFVQLVIQLPPEVQKHYLKYLAMFRPASGCAMQTAKAERLTREIVDLIKAGHVQEKGKVDRPCSPGIWAAAMERMQEQAATLNLPMKSHGYLKTIAWQLADQADSKAEKSARAIRVTRPVSPGPVASIQNPLDEYIQGLRDTRPSDEEMDEWRRAGKKL